MENAFAWIGAVINWVGLWIPRITICDTTHGWVKFVRGKHVKSGNAGLIVHWPLVTKLVLYPVVRDSLNCNSQTVTLQSGETVFFDVVVIYTISMIEKLVAETAEPITTIEDLTMGAALGVIEGIESWAEIQRLSKREPRTRNSELNYRLISEIRKALAPYGVNALDAFLQNKAKTRVYKLVMD